MMFVLMRLPPQKEYCFFFFNSDLCISPGQIFSGYTTIIFSVEILRHFQTLGTFTAKEMEYARQKFKKTNMIFVSHARNQLFQP